MAVMRRTDRLQGRWAVGDYAAEGSMSGTSRGGVAAAGAAYASRAPVRRAVCVLGAALVWVSFCACAGDDLLSVYQEARLSSPVLRQARANYQAVQELGTQAFASLLPNIRAQASRDRIHLDQTTSFRSFAGYFFNTQYSIDLTQPIFNYSAYQGLDLVDAQIAQAAAQVHAAEQNLMFTLAQRYFGVLSARAGLVFARSDRKAIKRQLEQAQQRFQVGVIAHTAVEEAQARLDLAESRLIQAENDLANRLEAVRQLIGVQPEPLAGLAVKPKLKGPQPARPEPWQLAAAEHNWQLIAARKGASAAMENIQVQRGGHLPTISLTANATHQETGGVFGGTTDRQSIGIQGELPIFQGFAVVAQVDEAQARYTEALAQLDEVRRNVRQDTANSYRAVQTSIRQVRALQQAVASNRSALEATQAGYDAGTRTIVDVLNAQSSLFGAIRDYQQAQHNYLVNTLRLKQAAGTLSPQDLQAINSLLGSP